jgi:hypothetical protein
MTSKMLEGGSPVEEWSDQELLDQYRFIAAEFSQEPRETRERDNSPAQVLIDEIRRRGLEVPAEASLASPGREVTQEGVSESSSSESTK